jgi:hypothetical protein
MLASFLGVLPILTPPLCALAFIMCSESNPLVVFALDLMLDTVLSPNSLSSRHKPKGCMCHSPLVEVRKLRNKDSK